MDKETKRKFNESVAHSIKTLELAARMADVENDVLEIDGDENKIDRRKELDARSFTFTQAVGHLRRILKEGDK